MMSERRQRVTCRLAFSPDKFNCGSHCKRTATPIVGDCAALFALVSSRIGGAFLPAEFPRLRWELSGWLVGVK